MRADLHVHLAAELGGRNRDRDRPGVDTARDVGAVDLREDLLVCARALAEVGIQVHLCVVSRCSSWMAWPTTDITASRESVAPLGLPGTLMIKVRFRTPAMERDSSAIGVLPAPARRIASPMPGTS